MRRYSMASGPLTMYLVLSILFAGALAQFNQECYFAKNQLAGSAIIPCFDTSNGVSPCCQNGDICLSDMSCWSPKTGVTYQYGCTDSEYEHSSCPKKCGLNVEKSNWVGLIYCNDTTNMWACNHPDTCGNCPNSSTWDPAIQVIPDNPHHCQDLKTTKAAFAGPISLMPSLSLPANGGSSTLYFSPSGSTYIPVTGYIPSWAQKATSAQRMLSSGAKIGIAVASAVGGLIVLILIVILILRRRYIKQRKEVHELSKMYGGDVKAELPASNEVKPTLHELESPFSPGGSAPLYLKKPPIPQQPPKSPTELNEMENQIYEMSADRRLSH